LANAFRAAISTAEEDLTFTEPHAFTPREICGPGLNQAAGQIVVRVIDTVHVNPVNRHGLPHGDPLRIIRPVIGVHAKATGLYMICTLNKHEVEAEGYHDALMLDSRGFVAEGSGANIFLVQDGKLHTPTPDSFLNGLTRQAVIALAEQRQIPVVERSILPEEFARTSEVFVTGTAAEVTPVAEIDDYRFTPGRITRALMEDFHAITTTG